MAGFGVVTLMYLAAIMLAWVAALVGGMFLQRAGFRQSPAHNPGYVMLIIAAVIGLIAAITSPSAQLAYVGLGSPGAAIFGGFIGALIAIVLVAGIGYLLSPRRLERLYSRVQSTMDSALAVNEPDYNSPSNEQENTEREHNPERPTGP